jgi:TnpA family transposase
VRTKVLKDQLRETTVINAYAQFPLQRLWGLGKSASADGMKWDLYPQNLMSEYHIRYGGYGGIGYYLVSDSYIVLFSHALTRAAPERDTTSWTSFKKINQR